MSGQDNYFDTVVADRLNALSVSSRDREQGVVDALILLEKFYDKEVAARGGTLSAAALSDIMTRGIDLLSISRPGDETDNELIDGNLH